MFKNKSILLSLSLIAFSMIVLISSNNVSAMEGTANNKDEQRPKTTASSNADEETTLRSRPTLKPLTTHGQGTQQSAQTSPKTGGTLPTANISEATTQPTTSSTLAPSNLQIAAQSSHYVTQPRKSRLCFHKVQKKTIIMILLGIAVLCIVYKMFSFLLNGSSDDAENILTPLQEKTVDVLQEKSTLLEQTLDYSRLILQITQRIRDGCHYLQQVRNGKTFIEPLEYKEFDLNKIPEIKEQCNRLLGSKPLNDGSYIECVRVSTLEQCLAWHNVWKNSKTGNMGR